MGVLRKEHGLQRGFAQDVSANSGTVAWSCRPTNRNAGLEDA